MKSKLIFFLYVASVITYCRNFDIEKVETKGNKVIIIKTFNELMFEVFMINMELSFCEPELSFHCSNKDYILSLAKENKINSNVEITQYIRYSNDENKECYQIEISHKNKILSFYRDSCQKTELIYDIDDNKINIQVLQVAYYKRKGGWVGRHR
jgi:hypothetical protein